MSKTSKLIIAGFCLLKLIIQCTSNYHSGFQGDELLHIESGNHLAWGYMEYPPMIGWLGYLQNLVGSDSVFVHRFFAHLASLIILIFLGKITWAIGGRNRAVFLVQLALFGIMGRAHLLFQPVVFSQLFWVMSFYFLIRFEQEGRVKHAWWLMLCFAFGLLTKYDMVFFIGGLSFLFASQKIRDLFIHLKLYKQVLIGLLMILPNIFWQWQHDFPLFNMFGRLYETQLNELSFVEVFKELFISLNPFNYLLFIAAFFVFWVKDKRLNTSKYVLGSILISALFLILGKGKGYYFYPIFLLLLPFGAWVWEHKILSYRKWLMYPLVLLIFVSNAILLPFNVPLTTKESFIEHEYPYDKVEVPGGKYGLKEERYSQEMWPATMEALREVYQNLPAGEKEDVLIWGKHYAQAGAISLFGEPYNLPKSFSLHGSFYSWLPKGSMPRTTLAIRFSDESGSSFFTPYFESVEAVKTLYNPYAQREEKLWQTIFICRDPKYSFDELKELFKHRIFE